MATNLVDENILLGLSSTSPEGREVLRRLNVVIQQIKLTLDDVINEVNT